MPRHAWYEKLFFYLQLREKVLFRLVFVITLTVVLCQVLLIFPGVRKVWVLGERFEGEPVPVVEGF